MDFYITISHYWYSLDGITNPLPIDVCDHVMSWLFACYMVAGAGKKTVQFFYQVGKKEPVYVLLQ